MKTLKKTLAVVALAIAALVLITIPKWKAYADAPLFGPFQLVNSANGVTNIVATNSGGVPQWGWSIFGITPATNVTPIPVINPNSKDLSLQITYTVSSGTVTGVVVTLARNVQGGAPAGNGTGTNLNLEQFLTWSNTVSASTTYTFCTNLASGNGFKGAMPSLYVYSIQLYGATNTYITNYGMWNRDN